MRNGKFTTTPKKALICVFALLIALSLAGVTLAYIVEDTTSLENQFQKSRITTAVLETLNGNQKENVKIQNTGDTEAYIRTAVVINWKDEEQNIFGKTPAVNKDYTILFNLADDGWVLGADGYYYYTKPVAPGYSTPSLISSCTANNTLTVGNTTYYLSVDIVCSGIQSTPTDAVLTHWTSGVSAVTDNQLTIITEG